MIESNNKKRLCSFFWTFFLFSYLQEPCTALFSTLHAQNTETSKKKSALSVLLSGLKEQTLEEEFWSEFIAQLLCITLG